MANVCTIVLNWNGPEDTIECLESIISADTVPTTIVVIDNGSSDSSVANIKSWINVHFDNKNVLYGKNDVLIQHTGPTPSVVLIEHTKNLGYANGNNTGIDWAVRQGCFDYIWVLNNDTRVQETALMTLLSCAENASVGIWGSTIVYADDPDRVQVAGGCKYSPTTTVLSNVGSGLTRPELAARTDRPRLDYIYGASMFFRTEVFKKCGLFGTDYFLFYEELDICRRAQTAGFEIDWCPDSVVEHKVGQSVKRVGDSDVRRMVSYHENLSTLIYTWRFHPQLFLLAATYRFLGKLVVLAWRGDWPFYAPLFSAYKHFLTQRERFSRPVKNELRT